MTTQATAQVPMSYPIPSTFPTNEINMVLTAIRNPTTLTVDDTWAAMVIAGYGLNILRGQQLPLTSRSAVGSISVLETELAKMVSSSPPQASAIPWDILIPILYDLFRKWLNL